MIDDKNAGTGFLMRDLIKYNSANHREKGSGNPIKNA
jgi:hypothetical protein